MKEKISLIAVQEFLHDFQQSSETYILEEGKEKDDILTIAKAKGINLKESKDLAGFKTIYTFADKANKNKARLPKEKLLKALPTIIGKPVDVDHIRKYVVGHYIDYRYKAKEDMVIAYGVFYKSNFGSEWETARELFGSGKLATSYEIWCPKNKRKKLDDGTYELQEMEIAGGALLFRTAPAFEDAKVLNIAKRTIENQEVELVYASKDYNNEELIVANNPFLEQVEKNKKALEEEKKKQAEEKIEVPKETVEVVQKETVVEGPKVEEPKTTEQVQETPKEETTPEVKQEEQIAPNTITCSNCKTEMPKPVEGIQELKCSNCFAILSANGEMTYPPQIIDFKLSCPDCNSSNWRILENKETASKLKCLSCAKDYMINFKTDKQEEEVNKLNFLYTGFARCHQCGTNIPISCSSKIEKHELTCSKCGLMFEHDIKKSDRYKQIESITLVIPEQKPEEPQKSSVEEIPEGETVEQKDTNIVEKSETAEIETAEVNLEQKALEAQTNQAKEENIEEAKLLKKQQRGTVVFPYESPKVKDKKDHFPINDADQARNALARVAQYNAVPEWYNGTLKGLQARVRSAVRKAFPSIKVTEPTKAKVLRKAVKKIMKIKKERKEMCKAHKEKESLLVAGIKKTVSQLIKAQAEIKKIKEEADEKIKFYTSNAIEIAKRREELGEFGTSLSDKDIMTEDKYTEAKLEKANASCNEDTVGSKVNEKDEAYYDRFRKEIDDNAFGRNKTE